MSINVANNNPHVVYTVAEGATQTTFSITFEFFDDDEVQLYVDGIIKTQGSGDGNYTITGGEGSTGTATFNTVSSGTQPVTGITGGSQVVITRNIPIERVTDFSAGSDINRAALNTQLDTLTAIAADNKMRSVRALTAPITDPTDVGTSLVIPKAADRANGFLSFDSNGNAAINSVVDLSFLTLERLDIDNIRIDGNTVSSTTGSLILAPTADVEINIPASSSLYMQRAGTTALDFAFTSISQEVRFINTTTATTYSLIQSNHFGGTDSDLVLKSDGGPLVFDVGNGTIPIKDDGVQRGYLNISTANTIKLYTGTGSGTLNTTFDGADVTIAGELVVSGNLTVDGTTTTINSTTLTVDDKNIVLASGATTSLAADGAGITIDGASATLTYVHLTGAMTFNKDVDIGDNDIENAQKLHFTENVSLYPSSGDDSILNLQAEDVGSAQLRFITGTGSGVFRGGIVASQNNVFGLKDSNEQTFIKSQDGNLPTQIFHTYDSPSAGSSLRIEAGSNFVKLYGSEGVEAQKYKDADDTSYYLEPAGTSVLATVGATQLNVDNITINGNTISSTDTNGNINLRCNGSGVVDVDSELFVYGNAINGTSAYVQIGNTDTGGDDIRIQGPNPNFTLYDSTAVADGVAAYTGGVSFRGQKTNTAYHTYSTIRPRIINGLDSDTARTGALHFGISDGASAATTNIIFKIEPDGIEVAGNITSTNDPLKISATTTSSTANIILEGDASPILSLRASGSNDDKITFKSDGAFQYINTNDQLTIQTGTNDALFLFGSSNIRTDAISGTHTISSRAGDISFITGTSGSTTERMRIAGAGGISVSADMTFGDNDKAIFGAGSDLQIYHNGSESIIKDAGTGNLKILATDLRINNADSSKSYITGVDGGYVNLYYNGSQKLVTTSTGIDVTGGVSIDDDNNFSFGDGTTYIQGSGAADRIKFITAGSEAMRIDSGGVVNIKNTASTTNFVSDTATSFIVGDGSGSHAMTLYSGTANNGSLYFADGSSGNATYRGGVQYLHGSDAMRFFTSAAETMRIDSSGNVGIGVVPETWNSANNGLQVGPRAAIFGTDSGYSGFSNNQYQATDGSAKYIVTAPASIINLDPDSTIKFRQAASGTADTAITWSEAMRIDSSGNVGIGESSPQGRLHLKKTDTGNSPQNPAGNQLVIENGDSSGSADIQFLSASNGYNHIFFGDAADANVGVLLYDHTNNSMQFQVNTSEAMRIDSSGNVGIQVVPKTTNATVTGSLNINRTGIIVRNNEQVYWTSNIYWDASDQMKSLGSGYGVLTAFIPSDGSQRFYNTTASAGSADANLTLDETMRITSAGNLLVGKTSADYTTAGVMAEGDGTISSVKAGTTGVFNRLTSDGDILQFRKDGTTVGSIGTDNAGDLFIGTGDTGLLFVDSADAIMPWNTSPAARTEFISLGDASNKFKNLYLSGGVYLGGTGAANKLDDFEEGQFDVTISPATSGTISISTSYDKMRYTKVGNIVHVQGEIRVAAVSSPVGADVRINNLPFTSLNGTDFAGRVGGATYYYQASSTSIQVKAFRVVEQDNKIRFAVDASTVTANDEFAFNFTYTVA